MEHKLGRPVGGHADRNNVINDNYRYSSETPRFPTQNIPTMWQVLDDVAKEIESGSRKCSDNEAQVHFASALRTIRVLTGAMKSGTM
jgi:hypothetical protein